MANDLNQCNFIGRAGSDCEIRYTPGGDAVASVNIAVGKSFKGKDGNKQERTEWVSLVAWRQLAEIMAKCVTKGKQIFITGELQTRTWDKDGVKQYKTEVVVSNMQLLGGGTDAPASGASRPEQRQPEAQSQSHDSEYPPFDPEGGIPF
jgi:single-strand DNA-binding protein